MMSKTKYVILGLLMESPLSGYEIKKLINARFRFFWNESYGQIYPELKKLVLNGWVEIVEQPQSARKNVYYKITEKGFSSFQTWLNEKPDKESIRIEMLLKVYHAKFLSQETVSSYINQYKEQHLNDLMILKSFKEELNKIDNPYGNHQDILNVIEFGILTNESYLIWCDQMLKQYQGVHHEKKN